MLTTMADRDMIKVYLSHGETGWAERLKGNCARVSNIPMDGSFNLGDVVEIVGPDQRGIHRLGRVVQRKYSHRSNVRYPKPFRENFEVLNKAFTAEGASVEGAVEGMMMVAHDVSFDAVALAKAAGIDVDVRPANISARDMLN
jgi:hypothetical protein